MTEPSLITFRDLAEILWLPALIGMVTAAATWLIWYYTVVPCPPESASLHHCNPARVARYINSEIWALMLTLGSLVGGIVGGGTNYTMFSRERAARIAAETLLAEERTLRNERIEEERKLRDKMLEEERRLREEDRRRIDQLVEQLAEHSRQTAEVQRQAAEHQRQSSEAQQAMMTTIATLMAELVESRRQRNGENGH